MTPFINKMTKAVKREQLYEVLTSMADHGSSVILNWGEDNNLWECSWIVRGKRYTGFSKSPLVAVEEAVGKVLDDNLT